MKLATHQDAIGQAVYDRYRGAPAYELIERDDGYVDLSGGPDLYLSAYRDWPAHVRKALHDVRGRVLDIGCNAGRHGLHLQSIGHRVLGIDISPLAIKTAKLRGLAHARVMSITQVSKRLGTFETVIMLGNNLGLFANRARARWLLRRFKRMLGTDGRVILESTDVYRTDNPHHLRYQRHNRRRGRLSGQIRLRVRYQHLATPWFDYLMVSPSELAALVSGTGWTVRRYYDSGDPAYGALLELEP